MLTLLSALAGTASKANETVGDTRTTTKSFQVNDDAMLNINAHESSVNINTWNENIVEVKVTVFVEAWNEKDMETMFDLLSVDIQGNSEQVDIVSTTRLQHVNVNDDRIKVKSNGMNAKVKSYEVSYEINMPATNHLNIKNRYGSVKLGEHRATLNAELYECEVQANSLQTTKSTITLKYSHGNMGTISEGNLELYESDITLSSANNLTLDSKYSSMSIGNVKIMNAQCYEGSLDIGSVDNLRGSQRYSSLDIGVAKEVELETHEASITVSNTDLLNLKDSKYSTVEASLAKRVISINGYETSLEVGNTEQFNATGKYCNYKVTNLGKSLTLDGYESSVRVGVVNDGFKEITIDGKYMSAELGINPSAGYALEADVNYGSVSYPTKRFDVTLHREIDDRVEVKAKTHGYAGDATVIVTGYETSLEVQ